MKPNPKARKSLQYTLLYICIIGVLLTASKTTIQAGPPLVSDDSGTVGKGMMETIIATSGAAEGGANMYRSPILDLTYGLTDRFDLAFVFKPVQLLDENQTMFDAVSFTAGFKWQFLEARSITSSVTPAVTFDTRNKKEVAVNLPIQVEYSSESVRFGSDLNYTIVRGVTDGWQVGVFGGWTAVDRAELLFEVWSVSFEKRSLVRSGWTVGLDAVLSQNIHLLVGGGTGMHLDQGDRLDWQGYFGILMEIPLQSGVGPS